MNLASRRTPYIVSLIILVIALAAYGKHWRQTHAFQPNQLHATYLPEARALSPFQLMDSEGKEFSNQQLQGHWTLMFFGFTHCKSICPVTMAILNQTFTMLQKAHSQSTPEVVFVSVDPARDSIETIKQYVISFNANFKGVRGEDDAIARLAREMAVVYMQVATQNDTGHSSHYDINHSGTIMLLNPRGELQAFFTPPHQPEVIAKEFSQISSVVK